MIVFYGAPKIVAEFESELKEWLAECVANHDFALKGASYSFLGEEEMIKSNVQFLQHNYLTDIITFNYSSGGRLLSEMLVNVDFIAGFAQEHGKEFHDELDRVFVHGLLHCMGFDDASEKQRGIMRKEEDKCLLLRPKKLKFRLIE